jgi:hypothetical protein
MNHPDKITVKYRTREDYCSSCSREFDVSKTSKTREFDVKMEEVFEYNSWGQMGEFEDRAEMIYEAVDECLSDMISFFAANIGDAVFVDKSDIDKISQIILDKY